MAAATTIDLVINQKSTFQIFLTIKDSAGAVLNLTNYTPAAKYKETYQTPDTQSSPFTATVSNAVGGEVSILLNSTQTSAMAVGKYVYDVTITDINGYKIRVCEGKILVSGGVS